MALSTRSKPRSSSTVGAWLRRMSTLRSSIWSRIQSRYQLIFSLPGTMHTKSIAPPSSACFSNSVTRWPRSVAIRAASMPAGPPPTTATFTGFVVGRISAYARCRRPG